jgi:hypothetical protein
MPNKYELDREPEMARFEDMKIASKGQKDDYSSELEQHYFF